MRLRSALALRVVVTTLPLCLIAGEVVATLARDRARERVSSNVRGRLEAMGEGRCLRGFGPPDGAPRQGRFRAHGPEGRVRRARAGDGATEPAAPTPHRRLAFYAADFSPTTADAPPLPEPIVSALRRGDDLAVQPIEEEGASREWMIIRSPRAEVDCTYAAVVRHLEPSETVLGVAAPAILTALAFAVGVLFASGPVVRRIVRLAHEAGSPHGRPDEDGADEIGDLARTLRQRSIRIDAQMKELGRRERALRDYIADTTHDVLVPLTVLSGELDAIARATDASSVADARTVRVAIEEAQYMGSLLHNLNARARLSGGLVTRVASVSLDAIVERVVSRHRTLAERGSVSLDFGVPESAVFVSGDPTLIEQAIGNLVHNAVRHNREGGHVAVVLRRASERFVLVIEDDGPGVPEAMLPRLGERGLRADEARTRAPQGTGIGLHITRDVASLHRFELTFSLRKPSGLIARLEGACVVDAERHPRGQRVSTSPPKTEEGEPIAPRSLPTLFGRECDCSTTRLGSDGAALGST